MTDLVKRLRSRREWGSQLADEAADEIERLRAEKAALMAMAKFGLAVLDEHRDNSGGELEGLWLEDTALETGVLEQFTSFGPCSEESVCVCAEIEPGSTEGYDCNRVTDATKLARKILAGNGTEESPDELNRRS